MSRKKSFPLIVGLVLALALTALFSTAALAGKTRYTGTLTATPNVLEAGDSFTVTGCGYNLAYGNVIVNFTGGSWGSALDENGCFTIAHIPALSGDTLPVGTYEVSARQLVGKRWTVTGETTVTVVR